MRKHDRVTVSASAFRTGYAELKVGPVPILDVLVKRIRNCTRKLAIDGHTSNDMSEAYNADLSQRRADAVRSYLYAKGIDLHRMQTVGRGASVPVSTNETAAGRELNRRVEVTVIPA